MRSGPSKSNSVIMKINLGETIQVNGMKEVGLKLHIMVKMDIEWLDFYNQFKIKLFNNLKILS